MITRLLDTTSLTLIEGRCIKAIINTPSIGRDKLIVISKGVRTANFANNPSVQFQHNPDWPIARSTLPILEGDNLVAVAQFPPPGVSARSDEVYGLIKAGAINAVSMGFEVISSEPINPGNPRDGMRITECELAEWSFVSVPALPDALVTERSNRAHRSRNAGKMRRKRMAELYAAEQRAVGKSEKPSKHQRMAALYAKELARK